MANELSHIGREVIGFEWNCPVFAPATRCYDKNKTIAGVNAAAINLHFSDTEAARLSYPEPQGIENTLTFFFSCSGFNIRF